MVLLRKITFPMLRDIKLSNARQKKYYILVPNKEVPKLPEKYQKPSYGYLDVKRAKGMIKVLCDLESRKPIVKNYLAAGTPKYIKVNFQKIWNAEISEHTRNKIAIDLKDSYQDALSKVVPITEGFPLKTIFTMYTKFTNLEEQDVDNLSILYVKTFHDAIVEAKIIPDDKLRYLKRYEAGHEYSDSDYIVVEIYSIGNKRITRRSL